MGAWCTRPKPTIQPVQPTKTAVAQPTTTAVAVAQPSTAAIAQPSMMIGQASESGCVVMYDDRVSVKLHEWYLEMYQTGRRVFDANDESAKEDQPYSWEKSCVAMIQANQRYARNHRYAFRFLRTYPPYDQDHPPYWLKVKLLRDTLYENSFKHDYAIWLDTDACVDFHSQNTSLKQLFAGLPENVFLLFSPDQPGWEAYLCAGVLVVKNGPKAREFFDEWLGMYDASAWSKGVDGKWHCSGEWAGPKYEQGAGSALVQTDKYKNDVKRLPWFMLSNHNYKRPGRGFAMHFAGIYKLYIEPYVRQNLPPPLPPSSRHSIAF